MTMRKDGEEFVSSANIASQRMNELIQSADLPINQHSEDKDETEPMVTETEELQACYQAGCQGLFPEIYMVSATDAINAGYEEASLVYGHIVWNCDEWA